MCLGAPRMCAKQTAVVSVYSVHALDVPLLFQGPLGWVDESNPPPWVLKNLCAVSAWQATQQNTFRLIIFLVAFFENLRKATAGLQKKQSPS